jgi:putative membrane protein insertion efficiency factor
VKQKFWTLPIKGYQYISKMLPASCRYYPTCSEYAKWQFECNAPHKALTASTLRILRCNQLFAGGIDYPVIRFEAPQQHLLLRPSNRNYGKIRIRYWLVPKEGNQYYLLKDLDGTYTPLPS